MSATLARLAAFKQERSLRAGWRRSAAGHIRTVAKSLYSSLSLRAIREVSSDLYALSSQYA